MAIEWKWRGEDGQPGSCFYCGQHRSLHREKAVSATECPQMQIMLAADEIEQLRERLSYVAEELHAVADTHDLIIPMVLKEIAAACVVETETKGGSGSG